MWILKELNHHVVKSYLVYLLGPTLFLMYINDIHKSTKSKLIIYADDITLLYSTKKLNNIISHINDDLNKLKHWFEINKVIVNVKKTSYIIFRSPQHTLPLNIPEVKYDNQTLQS